MTGRKDHQFKHLGYRIESGEIENAINQLEGIQQSCVIYDSREKWIQVFYTVDGNKFQPGFQQLLGDLLPQHMSPHSFLQLEKFPMTLNGKINRNAIASIKK